MRRFNVSPMLGVFAAFEFKYQLRSKMFVITTTILFAFCFTVITVPRISKTLAGASHINSPHVLNLLVGIVAFFAIFILIAFLSSVVIRDYKLGTEGLFFTRPITELDYLAGRFIGAFAACCVVISVAPLAMLLGSNMPWLDPELVGPFRPLDYLSSFSVFGIANLLITGVLLFTVANVTRSSMATYTATVLFLALNFAGPTFGQVEEYRWIVALLDPYGSYAYGQITRYWTPHELNTRLVPLQGLLLWNRGIWLGVAAALMAYNAAKFSFRAGREKQPHKRSLVSEASAVATGRLPKATLTFDRATLASQFLLRVRYEAGRMFRSFSFWFVLVIGLVFALAPFPLSQALGTTLYPLSRVLINATDQFQIVPIIVLIYFAAELMWRDREYRMHEILDVTPTPSWVFVLSKFVTLWLILLALFAVYTVAVIAMQLILGGSWAEVELSLYARRALFFNFYQALLVSVLSLFAQVVTNNRYAGMLAMIVLSIATQAGLRALGFEQNLYRYADGPDTPYSDMNGDGHFVVARNWFFLYWTWFAALLVVLAFALWNRGAKTSIWRRLRTLPLRLGRSGMKACAVLLAGFIATGAYIFYNTNILNTFVTSKEAEQLAVDYEHAYRQYETLPQPRIVDTKIDVDIYPRERRYEARGSYVIENKTAAPISQVHVGYGLGTVVRSQQLERATLVDSDERLRHYIWQFDTPLQPLERRTLKFEVARRNRGFRDSNNRSSVLWNGTFIQSAESMPFLGFNPRGMLQDREARKRHDLKPIDRMPPLEDEAAAGRSYLGADADWMTFETTVSTSADQIALAPGDLQREWEENGRRYFHYRMETPIAKFYSFLSARYAVAEEKSDGVLLQVFYHPAHRYNVARMIEAMRDGIAYNKAAFSPFQHRQMRIFEFPLLHGRFAQSFPNSVPFSEAAGFIEDNRDPKRIDNVYYITAHEVAHQWWAHQILGANMQGATLLSETFAQYSALMLMKRKYGEHHVRRFLKSELDKYLAGRRREKENELPLYRVENQTHIHYNKGSLVMYALQDYLGEDVVNRALARMLREHAYAFKPYPRSTDFLRILRAEAGPKYDALIADLFEKIVLFDLKATDLKVTERSDGRFDVRLTVQAKKFEASGKGEQTEVRLDNAVDIGLFARHPDDVTEGSDHVLLFERRAVRDGKNVFEFVLDAKPALGGIDPYNKLIDRASGDNLISVGGKYRDRFQVIAQQQPK